MLNLVDIDIFLKQLDCAADDSESRILFNTFKAPFDLNIPDDPFSNEYRDHQFAIYKVLAGKTYLPLNEKSPFDVDAAAVKPFPYLHKSCELVGNQLMAIGFLIKALNLRAGARILEFGPGWGNTTLALAKMGFEITAVDIEQNFIDLINKRAIMEGLTIEAIHGDFSLIETVKRKFDAVLFFECFHHSSDHLALIAGFENAVEKGGLVCFAAEPINPEFPIPWGLRMDGESIWAIRKNGWLELGFNQTYFRDALGKFGWRGLTTKGHDSPWSSVIIAKRLSDWGGTFDFREKGLCTQIGKVVGSSCVSTGSEGYLAYGPYISLPAGAYQIEILADDVGNFYGELLIDVVVNSAATCITQVSISSATHGLKHWPIIPFTADYDMHNLEVRIFCSLGTHLRVSAIRITAV